jgi:hypothetical protein
MKGSKILITGEPQGRHFEGPISIASGTLLPGTIMQIKAATAIDGNGHFTFTQYNRDADGNRPAGPYFVLMEKGEGYTYAEAYSDGDHCHVYAPLPGDELNILWSTAGTGTGDSVAVGALAIIDDGTGLLVATTGTPEDEPFVACEALTDTTATGTLTHCMRCG